KNVGELILASSDKDSNITYASGFRAPDPFIYYSTPTEKGIIVSKLESSRATSEAHAGVAVHEIGDFVDSNDSPGMKDVLLAVAKKNTDLKWRVPSNFPLFAARFLEKSGVKLECVDRHFFPKRQFKTDEEVAKIVQGQRLAEMGMVKAATMLSSAKIADNGYLLLDGEVLTSEKVRFEIDVEIMRAGGNSIDTIASCAAASAEPHNLGSGPLLAGETIVIDIFPKGPDGYHGDLTRTFVVGDPSEIVRNAYEAVRKARDEAKKALKAGVIPSEIHKLANDILVSSGFETTKRDGVNRGFFHGLGHGLGLDVHEAPSLSSRNSQPLEIGDVVTVEPGLYYPEWGGVRLEDVVVIRENDCETLTECPTSLDPGCIVQ
ncbi:MAG: aminopeptidase P family protein, partial [Victivallales bacterium]|nr:aminopeptidase P family protein [Victivallales bacterium]